MQYWKKSLVVKPLLKHYISMFQILINMLTLVLLYVVSYRFFSANVAHIATIYYAIDPLPIFYSLPLLTESFFAFVFLLSFILIAYGVAESKKPFQAAGGISLGLSILIRPVAQFYPILLVLLILTATNGSFLMRFKKCALIVGAVLIVISPWLTRNYIEYGAFALTSQKGEALLGYNAALMESVRTNRPYETVRDELMKTADSTGETNPFIKSRIQSKYAIDLINKSPTLYCIVHLKGMVNMFLSPSTRAISEVLKIKPYEFPPGFIVSSSFIEKVLAFFKFKPLFEILLGLYMVGLSLIAYAFAAIGFIELFRRKEYFFFALLFSTIFYFAIITGPFGEGRFRLPVIPIYAVIGAYGLNCLTRH